MSINRQASGITERNAGFIEFDQTNTWGQIGDPKAAQEQDGVDWPNVQSAIDDIYDIARVPPGGVVTTISSNNPGVEPTVSNSQVTKITVTGTPSANGTVVIDGISVAFLSTDTTAGIATKIRDALIADTALISSATVSTNTVTYTYVDANAHNTFSGVVSGVTFTSEVQTLGGDVGYIGYGTWQLLGSETKYSKMIYSWLRVA
jgi:hypothetical protein